MADEDEEATEPEAMSTALPPRVESWRRRSATGAILTGIAFGLREVFETKPDEPAMVLEAAGGSTDPSSVGLHLDLEHPERSTVVLARPSSTDNKDRAVPPAPGDGDDGSP